MKNKISIILEANGSKILDSKYHDIIPDISGSKFDRQTYIPKFLLQRHDFSKIIF